MKDNIHTTITKGFKNKLLQYGKGSLQNGIENLIQIAESKEVKVVVETEINIIP